MSTDRRGFLKALGLFPVAIAGAKAADLTPKPEVVAVKPKGDPVLWKGDDALIMINDDESFMFGTDSDVSITFEPTRYETPMAIGTDSSASLLAMDDE